MGRVRLAMVGCGWGATALYAAFFRYLEKGELVAVMDINESNARMAQQRTGARKVYTELGPLLEDPEIDAVMVATPPFAHAEQVIRLAEAGKHVYCEKPMCKTVQEADTMIAACHRCGVKLQVGFMKRFNPSFRLAKRVLDEGQIGDIFEMRAVWDNARARTSRANYRHSVAAGGGFLQEDGSHPIDVCRWWLGEVEQVSAEVMVVGPNRFDNEQVGAVTMKHRQGGLSTLHITMLTHRTGEESYEVYGTRGTLLMRWPFHSTHTLEPAILQVHRAATQVEDLTLSTSWDPQGELEKNWQYLNELRGFCDCILYDREPEVTGADGRAAVEIINAAYISTDEGRKVRLPLSEGPDFEAIFAKLRAASRWKIPDEETWWSRY
jgi:UDP-N-acetyl-2-amino-2-deoxyglucuronate dehydrogenase